MAPPAAETGQAGEGTQNVNAIGDQYEWNAIGIHPMAGLGLFLGLVVAVIGGFLSTLYSVQEDPATGLATTATWFIWIGFTLVSVSLVAGGLVASTARAGVRVAMVAIGLFTLIMTTNAPQIMTGFPGF